MTVKENAEAIASMQGEIATLTEGVQAILGHLKAQAEEAATPAPSETASESTKAAEPVRIIDPSNPATRRQRKALMALTGTYPNDANGFAGLSKGQASKAITDLREKGRAKVEVAKVFQLVGPDGSKADAYGEGVELDVSEWTTRTLKRR
ncbi:MAG: hypothetical protein GWN12_06585 [Thermoplasmata archaeon]|nr:hypothetical protein [Thermoplasmata archaeon]NIS11742.1 hypothetical protein [Thermoplasmata archaeon]NIS19638.1 hypothetical protein [Thermoplasmata archaeon]NIT76810.1 hypothetical protein [Thermoplasmata archaeon]NIW88447.1 hypothetical protein [Thermoplasmata archaeon]